MTVITIVEDNHGLIGIASGYEDAVDYLIEKKWLDGDDEYCDSNENIAPLKYLLGADWEEKIASWNIKIFNEFFEGCFYLQMMEVHERMGC